MRSILLVLAAVLFVAPNAFAGEVYKRKCPYSCKSAGIAKNSCKDWKQGNMCFIEVMGNPRKSSGGKTVLRRKCPNSCKSLGLPKSRCKDWKEGKKCVVEFS